MTDKITVVSPDGTEEEHTPANARDLVSNAGWTVKNSASAPAPAPVADEDEDQDDGNDQTDDNDSDPNVPTPGTKGAPTDVTGLGTVPPVPADDDSSDDDDDETGDAGGSEDAPEESGTLEAKLADMDGAAMRQFALTTYGEDIDGRLGDEKVRAAILKLAADKAETPEGSSDDSGTDE